MKRLKNWWLRLIGFFKKKKEDRLVALLQRVGFTKKGFLSLAFNQQYRTFLRSSNYEECIAVLNQKGSKDTGGLEATFYIRKGLEDGKKCYRLLLVVSSDHKPLCVFHDCPELVLPYNCSEEMVHTVITSWLQSIITLYVAAKLSENKYAKELKVTEKVP